MHLPPRLPSDLFVEAFNEHRFSDSEHESLVLGFERLRDWIHNSNVIEPATLSPVFSQLYLLSFVDESQSIEILTLCNQILKEGKIGVCPKIGEAALGQLWLELQSHRISGILTRINDKQSLTHSDLPADFLSSKRDDRATTLYTNQSDKLEIDFQVTQLPFPMQVLDPRLVRVAPGKTNELHKHAHETLFVFIEGRGHVLIDHVKIPVEAGDFVYIPRWCMHQSVNTDASELVFLAVADFGLTGKSFTGNYLKTARLKA